MISIVLVEDIDRDRERIAAIIKSQRDLILKDEGYDGYDAIKLAETYKPDIVLLSLNLNFFGDIEISHLLRCDFPETLVVLMSSRIEGAMIRKSICGKASAYLFKEDDIENLAAILRRVKDGEIYISQKIGAWAFRCLGKQFHIEKEKTGGHMLTELSRKEAQILILLSRGNTDKEIAGCLHMKDGTIRNYVLKLKKKIGTGTRTGLVRYVIDVGLVDSARLNNDLPPVIPPTWDFKISGVRSARHSKKRVKPLI